MAMTGNNSSGNDAPDGWVRAMRVGPRMITSAKPVDEQAAKESTREVGVAVRADSFRRKNLLKRQRRRRASAADWRSTRIPPAEPCDCAYRARSSERPDRDAARVRRQMPWATRKTRAPSVIRLNERSVGIILPYTHFAASGVSVTSQWTMATMSAGCVSATALVGARRSTPGRFNVGDDASPSSRPGC